MISLPSASSQGRDSALTEMVLGSGNLSRDPGWALRPSCSIPAWMQGTDLLL